MAPGRVAGPARGFRTLDAERERDSLAVSGSVPSWLTGSLLRIGPAKFEAGDRSLNHWFDGYSMLHRFAFASGAVSYANRFLETKAYRAASERGEIGYSEFATDPCRSLFKRVQAFFTPKISDNANVNVTRLGDDVVAMTEAPLPIIFDPATLRAAGIASKAPGEHTTAHPYSRAPTPAASESSRGSRRRGLPTCTASGSASATRCWRSARSSSTRSTSSSRVARSSRTTAGSPSAAPASS